MSPSLVTTESATLVPGVPDAAVNDVAAPNAGASTIPTDELYWAVLDAGALDGVGPSERARMVSERSPALEALLAPKLPVEVSEVHAVYSLLADGRVLVCAIPHTNVEERRTPGLLIMHPAAIPGGMVLGDSSVAAGLNFLVGPYEPQPIRKARRSSALIGVGAIVLSTTLAVLGIERRSAAHHSDEAAAQRATEAVLRQVLGANAAASDGAVQLEAELQRLRQTRMRPTTEQDDSPGALAALLEAWPRGAGAPHVRTETLSVGRGAIVLGVAADDRAAAVAISEALRGVKGWTLLQPQMSAADDRTGSVRLQLRLVPSEIEPAAAAGGTP